MTGGEPDDETRFRRSPTTGVAPKQQALITPAWKNASARPHSCRQLRGDGPNRTPSHPRLPHPIRLPGGVELKGREA
jgi:hypothetical protein